jgi:hypothetical protein
MPGPSFHFNHKTGKLEYPTGHTKPSGEAVTTTNPGKAYVRPPSVPIGSPTPSPSRPTPTRYTPRATPGSSSVFGQLSDLLTPGPSVHETAAAAHRLGVKSQQPQGIGQVAGDLIHSAAQGIQGISKDVAQLPKQRVHSDLGRKTLGTPTVAQLAGAVVKGQARVNRRGRLTIPATRHAAQQLTVAKQRVQNTTGVTGPLTPGQKTFVNHYAKLTGLNPRVVAAQALAEESGAAAQQREAEGNHNWLNIGYFDSGPGAITKQPVWSSPESAAKASAAFTQGKWGGASSGIQHILASAGQPAQQQINAIGNSGWATSAYGDALRRTIGEVGVKSNPKAEALLKAAQGNARALGIPTKGGDVEAGQQPHTVFVRADAKGFVQWAKALLGTQEGSRLQLKWAGEAGISAAQPWCAAFITAGMLRRGLQPPPDPAYSGSWLTWKGGTNVGTDIRHAKPGDVIVFGASEHIGLYVGGGNVIAGNWSNEVAEYPASEDSRGIQGIIRPHFKGGKVAVQESAVLPGAAIGPSGELVSGPAGVGAAGTASAAQQQTRRPVPALGSVPVSPLLATSTPMPTALQPGGSLESLSPEEANEVVASILKRKRL